MRWLTETQHVCQQCGNGFTATRTAKYCTSKCRLAHHRDKHRPDLGQALDDNRERENLWLIRDSSERGYATIQMLYQKHGLQPARLAILACVQTYANETFHDEAAETLRDVKRIEARQAEVAQ